MYTLHEHNMHGHGASKFVSCITSAGLGPVGENLLIIVPYDLVSDLVKVKDLRIRYLATDFFFLKNYLTRVLNELKTFYDNVETTPRL